MKIVNLKEFLKKYLDKNKVQVYDPENQIYYFRPLTLKEEQFIEKEHHVGNASQVVQPEETGNLGKDHLRGEQNQETAEGLS